MRILLLNRRVQEVSMLRAHLEIHESSTLQALLGDGCRTEPAMRHLKRLHAVADW